ncbi:two-partner secretion domain-containing protein [Pseudomonas syringae]|uniref:two-partner secretion domain-containing protein n=1 Tax=Pseudomonas syringae TaxID=317 RepID=UPI003F755BC5
MDVHQLALLARQPSAVLVERRSFWGMPKRGLALILANAMFWQPMLVQAEGIVVSGTNTSLNQAGNGVPIVNIAAPNASGLSHNQYQQFNVDSQGVILNNSTNQTQSTQLGGIIVGNSNLRGTAASTILNEVVGANASQLRGYTEVAGQAARVIVANPYGISCNGCGFINTPQVTLTTGKPVLDANGQLQRFNVQGGSISIDGVGLNADNVDQFDIITRSAKINAEIHAKRLNIIAGRNDVDAQTLNPTALPDDGSAKPELAVDSSALGGMYAGAIRLVGTEAGVGVRLAGDLVASGGDIQLDASGHLSMMQTAASSAVAVKANSAEVNGPVYAGSSLGMTTAGDLITRQNVAARDVLTLSAGGQINNTAVIEAGVNADNSRNTSGDVTLSANGLNNSGSITASRALQASISQTLNNQGATLNGQSSTRIVATAIDNRQSGRILSQGGTVDINASQVLNSQSGLISSNGTMTITAGSLDNSQQGKLFSGSALSARISGPLLNQLGLISANGDLLLNAASVDNRSAEISSLGSLTSTVSQFDNREKGRLLASGALQLTSDHLNNQNGSVAGQQGVQLNLGQLTNTGNGSVYGKSNLNVVVNGALGNDQGVLRSDGTLTVRAASLSNNSGSVTSAGTATVSTTGAVVNRGGQILSDAGLTLSSGSLDNSQSGRIAGNGVVLTTGAFDNYQDGRLTSTGALQLNAGLVNNSDAGRIASAMALTAVVTGLNQTNDGRLYSNSDVSLDLSNGLLTNQRGLITAPGQLLLKNLTAVNNQSGKISSANSFTLAATSLDNTDGSILSDKALVVRINQLLTNLRGLVSATGLDLTAGSLNNRNGEISSLGSLTANVGQFDNREKGRLLASGALLLTADGLNNLNGILSGQQGVQLNLGQLNNTAGGSVYAKDALNLTLGGVLQNDQGVLRSDAAMDLKAAGLTNTNGGVSSAGTGALNFNGAVVNQGGQIVSDAQLTLTSGSLDNSRSGRISGKGLVLGTGVFDNHQDGRLTSTGALQLNAGLVDNSGAGRIASAMALTAVVTGLNQTNDGRLYSNSDVSLDMSNGLLNNQSGQITAPGQLLLRNLNVVNNQSGKISSANDFTLAATSLDNTDGSLVSDKALIVRIAQLLTNLRGQISANGVTLSAAALDNRNAELSSLGSLTATIGQFDNREKGRLLANGALLLTAGGLNNLNGIVSGQQGVQLNLGQLNNTGGGSVFAKSSLGLTVSGALNNDQGVLRSDGSLTGSAASLANSAGSISSAGVASIIINDGVVNRGGQILSDAQLTLTSASLDNSQSGRIASKGLVLSTGAFDNHQDGRLTSTGALQLNAGLVNNSDAGRIASAMALTAVVTGLNQTNDGRLYGNSDVSLDLSNGLLSNQSGLINAPGQLLLKNLNVVNNQSGEISSANGFTLAANSLDNTDGSLLSDKALVVRINQLLTNLRGKISANGVNLSAATLDNRSAEISSLSTLTATIGQFDNSAKGRLLANGTMLLTADNLNNQNGVVSGQQGVQLTLGQLTNSGGSVYAKNTLGLTLTGAVNNNQGVLRSDGTLDLKAASLANTGGRVTSAGVATLQVDAAVVNQGGQIISDAGLTLSSASLDNSQSGRIAGNGVVLTTGAFDNHQDGRLTSTGALQLNAGRVNNGDAGRIASAMALTAVVTGLNQTNDGRLYSNSDVSLDLSNGVLTNQGGLINAPGQLLLKNLTAVNNQNGEISSANGFSLVATSLDNTDGSVISDKALIVRIDQLLTNLRGLISATGVQLSAATLDNRNAELSSLGELTATVGQFDNSGKGRLLANGTLLLNADSLNNQGAGAVSGQQSVQLNVGQLTNTGSGSVYAKNSLGLKVTGVLNNDQGALRSDGTLALSAASLGNTAGSITSAGASSLTVDGPVVNHGGQILGDSTLVLTSGSLDNSQNGRIAGKGVKLVTGAFDNQQGGRLTSTGTLKLDAALVNNSDAGRIASAMALTAVVTGLNQTNDGRLYSNSDVSLDLSKGVLNNDGGLITAPGQLLLKNLNAVSNRSGEISSANGFTLAATSLDNTAGSVLSDKALIVRVDQLLTNLRGLVSGNGIDLTANELNNNSGSLSSDADLLVNVTGQLSSRSGELTSAGNTTLNALSLDNAAGQVMADRFLKLVITETIDNQAGTLGAGQGINIGAASLDNRQSGALVTDGQLTLKLTGALDNRAGGSLQAKGLMDLSNKTLDNRGGRIAAQNLLIVHSDSVDNRGGSIRAEKGLQLFVDALDNSQTGLSATQKGLINSNAGLELVGTRLDNQNGLLNAAGLMQLQVDSVANGSGRIASQADMVANIGSLTQQGGELVAQGNLTLIGKTLDNRSGGLVGSTKALKIDVADIDNKAGELSSQIGVDIIGQTLDNSNGGKILAGTALGLTVARVINLNKGLLFGNTLRLDGTRLDNAGGTLASQKDMNISLSGALDNTGGLLSSESAMTVSAASLQNASGSLSSADALSVTTTGALENQTGSVTTDATLTLTSASLNNSQAGKLAGKGATQVTTGTFDNSQGGRLTSSDTLRLTAGKVINQSAGRIASALALTASVTSLDQQGGELFSNTSLSLDLNNGQLNNQGGLINAPGVLLLKNLSGVANQNGEISSTQAFTLNVDSLDNSGGKLLSSQALTLIVNKALSNVKGTISAAALNTRSDSLDNTEGLISSRAALDLMVNTALTNVKGTLVGDADMTLNAATVDNRLGQIASKQNLNARIGSLLQQNGQMLAQGTLTLRGDALDNRQNGFIGATQALDINVTSIDNRGGELSSQDEMTLTGQQLNNSDSGQVLAQKALNLNVAQITNRTNGLLSSQGGLTLVGSTLDNTGGALSALKALGIDLSAALDNTQGLISNEDVLTVKTSSLTNTAGSISSAGKLTLDSTGAISNQGGKLLTDGALDLKSASLDNSQKGNISGKGLLTLKTGDFDNSHNGRVSSSNRLDLTTARLTNSDGGSIGSSQALTASVSRLSQQGGSLFSNTSLSLDLNNGQLDNQGGLINAPGALLLKNVNDVLNQNGEISSAQAFTVNAQQLDNSGGKLLSNQLLTLRIARALTNVKGMIAAAGVDATANTLDNTGGTLTSRNNLDLTVTGALTNRDRGLINATQALKVGAASLDNQSGQVLGGTSLILNATSINNTAKGLINSTGTLNLTAGSLESGNGGEVSATRDMTLVLNALSLNGGRVMGDAGLSIDMQGNDLNNLGGLITADGSLTLNRIRDLNNQSGEVSSAQSFRVDGRTLDNSSGKLISSNVLTVNATNLLNQNGLISGWQGLNVSGNRLDNRNNGTLSSRSGSLVTTLTGELLNGGNGALVSQNTLSVTADSLDNSGGILSSGAGQTLTVAGLLNNSQNGLIDSGAGLTIKANALNNAAGNLTAQQSFSFEGSSLDNSAGNLSSKGEMTLDLLGSLTNTSGKLASGGNLLLRRSTAINNQAGQLISQSLMTLNTSGQLDNRNRGTVAANNTLTVVAGGSVLNDVDGLIYSQSADAHLNAASLSNVRGAVQSVGALSVDVAGTVDNQNGRIIAQNGDLNLSGANLYSQGGVLSSLQGLFTAKLAGVLKNGYDANRQGGVIQAQHLNLTALGGFDNYGGRVSARGGEALITTPGFDNRNGGLYAKGLVRVNGGNFDNSGDNDGQIAGGQVELNLSGALNNRFGIIESDSTLAVTAASLDNQTGQLRALGGGGATNFQIGNLFDNRNGTLESANSDLILNAGSFLNGGGSLLHTGNGTFDISTANLTNAGGSIVTRGGLTLSADSWTNSSVIQAGRLTVNVGTLNQTAGGQLLASNSFSGSGGNWTNDGLIASDGGVDIRIGGTFTGSGRTSSVGGMYLSAGQLNLNGASSITSGGNSEINIGGQLTNSGRLTSAGDLVVNAGGIANYGTLGAAQNLTLATPSLTNDRGLIFSGGDTTLSVNSFTNQNGDLYSQRALFIKGYGGGTQANDVSNISGSIESGGTLTINSGSFANRTSDAGGAQGFAVGRTLVSGFIAVLCNDCSGDHYNVDYIAREFYEGGQDNDTSASSLLTAGGDFVFRGGDFLNSKSTISATGNIDIQANSVKNLGAVSGSIERTRTYNSGRVTDGTVNRFMPQVVAYNQRNNPDFPYVYYVDAAGGLSLGIASSVTTREPGRDGGTIKTVVVKDKSTGKAVTNTLTGYGYGGTSPQSQYDRNNLVQLPAGLESYALISDVEVAKDGSGNGGRSAVIQAGGNVSINAKQDLQNSVIHQDYAGNAGTSKVQDTRTSGTGATVIRINAQLPPDLAQQQVNPLSLPGFSLPTGQNGLFRLSGQTGTSAAFAQPVGLPQSWTMGGAAVSVAQREHTVSDAQASTIQIGSVGQISNTTRQLASVTRQSAGVSANASSFDVSAPGAAPIGGFVLPGHSSDSAGVTSVDSVTGIATGNQGSGALLPVQNAGSTSGIPLITAVSSGSSAAQNAGMVQGAQVNKAGQVVNGAQGNLLSAVNQAPTGAQSGATAAVTQVVVNTQGGPVISAVRDPVAAQGSPVTAAVASTVVTQNSPVSGSSTQPAIVAQASAITPLVSAAAQTVTRVQGLPSSSFVSKPQKYLIETNPVLTELKQFMSSDYLLAGLGYDPEVSAKRLGDGLYEQRLVQQAVVARTGQAFIDGQTSNEAQFKYLMNNAIASKQQLNLAVGVSLNSQQVAALTHDIVWLEEHEVNGEKVLVPVLYLAQADNRLGPTGALIAGNDVSLIAGQNLDNVGTLHAANNLSAVAGNNLINTGLIEAGNRLDLLAGNDLINTAGGIIKGRDVSLTSINGDVINERSVTSMDNSARGQRHNEFADSAARIEAANDMSISAGRDVINKGSVLESGRDMSIQAGRDVTIAPTEVTNSLFSDSKHNSSDITQLGSTASSGRDLTVQAGRDISVIASQIDAKRDIAMAATENLTISSAADEEHSLSKSKKLTRQEDHVSQVAADLEAGGSVALQAGQNLAVISSRITAGKEAYLVAGENLDILAAQDSDYSLYDKKKKGSFGAKKTKRDEITDVKNIGSEITTGGDLLLSSGGDQKYQAAKLESGKDLTIESGGAVTFEGVKDSHQESHEKSDNNAFWVSSKGKGNTDETLRQSELVAAGEVTIKAVNGLQIDIRQVDQQTVTQSIDAMVKADPQLAWLKDAEKRGDVDWRQVKEIHDSFKYSNSGLGPASQIIIAIIMAAVVGPMAMGAVGASTGAAVTAGTMGANTAAFLSAGAGAVAAGAATNATVSVINNRGNLGAVFKDVTSSDAIKGYVISGVTAGLTAAYFDGLTGTHSDIASGKIIGPELSTLTGVGQFAANQILQNGTSAILGKALGTGGSGSDALKTALFNTLAAASFNAVGDYTRGTFADGTPSKVIIHAMVGGLLSKATGGDFRTGALAAGANEALVVHLNGLVNGNETLLTMSSQIVGALAAATQKDADASSIEKGSWIAKNSTQYNFLNDHDTKERNSAREAYEKDQGIDAARKLVSLEKSDQRSNNLLDAYKTNPESLTKADLSELQAYLQVYAYELTKSVGQEQAQARLTSLLQSTTPATQGYSYAGTTEAKNAYSDAARAELDGVFAQLSWSRTKTAEEQIYANAKGTLLVNNEQQGLANIGGPAIYALSGPLGIGIRGIAAINGAAQFKYGVGQAVDGDTWNAVGNMVVGSLEMMGGLSAKAAVGGQRSEPLGQGAKEAGAAGKVVDDIPATSPLARDGLREDLAAQAGIPRDIAGNPSSLWGKSIDDIKQSLTMDGATLTPKLKASSSGNAQVYTVEGSTTGIKEIQYSPSTIGDNVLSTHKGEYYKLTYADGSKVKVVDPVAYRPTFSSGSPIYDANTKYLNPQGQKVVFNSSTNTWVPE